MTLGKLLTREIRTGKEAAGNISTEERRMCIEIEEEHGALLEDTRRKLNGWKEICSGTQNLETYTYKKSGRVHWERSPIFKYCVTLVYIMEHEESEHW